MRVAASWDSGGLRAATAALLRRTLSPLVGLTTSIGFTSRGRGEPRFAVSGGELTGVHVLRDQPRPPTGFYHIGGAGIFLDEAAIRTVGETVERYSQFVAAVSGRHEVVLASYEAMVARGEPVIDPARLGLCSAAQYDRPGFIYRRFDPTAPLGWTRLRDLYGGEIVWAPAQLVLTGYVVRKETGEPWLLSAVTTGSAAHTHPPSALRNALLELVQVDAAMGHWYAGQIAPEILLDERTAALGRLLEAQLERGRPRPRFYWLRTPDLVDFTVACLVRERPGCQPAVSIGLGCDTRLGESMYKALLEAVGVFQLAKINILNLSLGSGGGRALDQMLDLDSNVTHYAVAEDTSPIDARFGACPPVAASALPADRFTTIDDDVRRITRAFRTSGKALYFMDLTTDDIRSLGFCALRVWSPDLLALCLPSAPPAAHPRYRAYGGFRHDLPHPYP